MQTGFHKPSKDSELLRQLYEAYSSRMLWAADSILHNPQDAEDAVQSAFVSVAGHLSGIDEIESPRTRAFLLTIVEHAAIDLYRKKQREAGLPLQDDFPGLAVPPPGDYGLADAMACLPAQYRSVLLLRYEYGYSVREIAAMLGSTPGAVKKRITRAKTMLQEQMEVEA